MAKKDNIGKKCHPKSLVFFDKDLELEFEVVDVCERGYVVKNILSGIRYSIATKDLFIASCFVSQYREEDRNQVWN